VLTLADIAEKAGTSVATVSLALRGRGMVARKTAERIRALADEMGYRPNPLLSSLAGKRFRSPEAVAGTPLAILNFPALPHGRATPISYHHHLMEYGRSLGYAPTIWNLGADADPAKLFRTLYHRMVQGILITGSVDARKFGEAFDWGEFAVVQCARFHSPQPFHIVRPNIFQAVKLAFNQLRELGYSRIGFATGRHKESMEDDEDRYGAAIAMESSYLRKKDRIPVYEGPIEDKTAFIQWFQKSRPDAVVGFGVGQYWMIKDAGFKIPEDVGFASLHINGPVDEFCCGLKQNMEEISRQSILLLDQLIRGRERGFAPRPLHLLVPSDWNEGSTLRPSAG
jgi:LacI family transcriptional regulator